MQYRLKNPQVSIYIAVVTYVAMVFCPIQHIYISTHFMKIAISRCTPIWRLFSVFLRINLKGDHITWKGSTHLIPNYSGLVHQQQCPHTNTECWQCDYIIRRYILNALGQLTRGLSGRTQQTKSDCPVSLLSSGASPNFSWIAPLHLYNLSYSNHHHPPPPTSPSLLNIMLTVPFSCFVTTRLSFQYMLQDWPTMKCPNER